MPIPEWAHSQAERGEHTRHPIVGIGDDADDDVVDRLPLMAVQSLEKWNDSGNDSIAFFGGEAVN